MRYAVDPRQMNLFEPASAIFSPMTIRYLSSDWPGIFRVQMLHLMPADALGEHFDAKLGCPTKELYGMAVLLRCAGWNLFRALAALKQRGIRYFAAVFATFARIQPPARRIKRWLKVSIGRGPHNTAPRRQTPTLVAA